MVKTKSLGIRIPLDLFKLVVAAEPDKSFSEIVVLCLSEKYGCDSCIEDDEGDGIELVPHAGFIEDEVDHFLNSHKKLGAGFEAVGFAG